MSIHTVVFNAFTQHSIVITHHFTHPPKQLAGIICQLIIDKLQDTNKDPAIFKLANTYIQLDTRKEIFEDGFYSSHIDKTELDQFSTQRPFQIFYRVILSDLTGKSYQSKYKHVSLELVTTKSSPFQTHSIKITPLEDSSPIDTSIDYWEGVLSRIQEEVQNSCV